MLLEFVPYSGDYSVSIRLESPFPSEEVNVLKYDISLKFFIKDGQVYAEVIKSDMLFDNEEVHDAFNDILLITAKAVDKIIVRLDKSGKAIGFTNLPEILEKRKASRLTVESIYEGDVVKEYLNSMEENLVSSEVAWKALGKNLFYTLFFCGLYKEYGMSKTIDDVLLMNDLLPLQAINIPVRKTFSENREIGENTIQMENSLDDLLLEPASIDLLKTKFPDDPIPEVAFVKINASWSLTPQGKITQAQMTAQVNIEKIFSKQMQIEVNEKLSKYSKNDSWKSQN